MAVQGAISPARVRVAVTAAIVSVREAVSEIKQVAKANPVHAAEGVVALDELIELVQGDIFRPYKRWAVKALAAQGRTAEAIRHAESCRSAWASDVDIDKLCEQILLSSGQVDEAYAKYALTANRAGTYLAWFRAVAKKYPRKRAGAILAYLVRHTPGDEG